ncbi:hypothetical protein V1226_09480 [Lachnospiraceae bacterium JLR.KK009]|jgi:hypothetical protein|nr:hypothetical protein C810_01706 [Lachnospiraceae bacterium A2]
MNLKKEKSIETPELKVKGNIMSWDGMMIQLSNVSSVSTAPLDQLAFPMLSVLLIFVGIVGLKQELFFGVLLLVLGGAWIYGWYYINNKRKLNTILSIVMNSGSNLQFVISNKSFLDKVLQVLELIIIEGDIGKQNITINIKGNTISGNAKVLNDLNML